MPSFRVTVYDRVVRTFTKVFVASSAEEATDRAEMDETLEGWTEHYDELSSSQHVAGVEKLEVEDDDDNA